MSWQGKLLEQLARVTPGGYTAGAAAASEPVAWAVMALARAGRVRAARRGADWLAKLQQRNGSVGVNAQQTTPAWPTSLAMLAWRATDAANSSTSYERQVTAAARWALGIEGRTAERNRQIGHDTTLVGWSWAEKTHSWLEPTAMFVVALREVGHGDNSRVREGARLLFDRLLPSGGCNYGNTLVLGQELLPHTQPTGLVLWALAGEEQHDPRVDRAIEFLQDRLGPDTTTASLAFGLLGITAQGRRLEKADPWLEAAAERELASTLSPYKLALLAMAAEVGD